MTIRKFQLFITYCSFIINLFSIRLSHPQDAELRTAPASEAPTTAGTTPTPGPGTDDGLTSPERRHRKALEYEEDDQDEPEEEVQLRDANVQIPNIPVPRSSDDNVILFF